jgi:hypothetical protein
MSTHFQSEKREVVLEGDFKTKEVTNYRCARTAAQSTMDAGSFSWVVATLSILLWECIQSHFF